MRSRLKISPNLIAVTGALWGIYGLCRLEALAFASALSPVETAVVRALGALIGGAFVVGVAYAQTLFRKRSDECESQRRE
jgi:hypothetical protein